MKYICLTIALALALLAGIPVLASDISDAEYYGIIQISNNSTATTNVFTVCSVNTTNLIDGNYLNAGATNAAVHNTSGADVPFMPGYPDNPWCIYVPSIGANAYDNNILYTNATGGETRYFPDTAGMTVADNETLELGDNFTVEVKGFVNTDSGTNKNLAIKVGAFQLVNSNSTNITAQMFEAATQIKYDAGDVTSAAVHNASWQAQTFTTVGAINVTTAQIKVYEVNTPPGISVNITATAAGKPTSTVLATATVDAATTATWGGAPGAWQTITFDGIGAWLEATTMYALTLSATTGDAANYVFWRLDDAAPTYADGTKVESVDDGVTWTIDNTKDFMFRLDGYEGILDITATGVASGEHTVTVDNQHTWLINGNFETGNPPDDWNSTRATAAQDSVNYAVGSNSVNITCNDGGGTGPAYTRQDMSTVIRNTLAGDTVTLGFYYQVPAANPYSVTVYIRDNDGSNNLVLTKDDVWHWGSVTRTLAAGITDLEVDWWVKNTAAVDTTNYMRVDGAVLIVNSSVGDGGNFSISIDGVAQDATFSDNTTPVPDNANQWTIGQNNAMPYIESAEIEVDGVQAGYWEWEYAATFTDQSANSNTATPTFRATSSDADVTAILLSFEPVTEAKAPAYALGDAPLFITATPNLTSTFTTTPVAGTFPLAGVIAAVASATDTPEQLPLVWLAGFVILAASLTFSATARKYGSGTLIGKILVIVVFMGIFVALANFGYDFWMVFVFLVMAIAMAMASKQLGWT